MDNLVHGKIFMAQEMFHHFVIIFFIKNYQKIQIFFQNLSNLHKISLDIRDIFKNLSLKSENPVNGGSLNRGFLT